MKFKNMIQGFFCVCIVQVQRGEKYNFKQVSQLNKNQTIQYVASKSTKVGVCACGPSTWVAEAEGHHDCEASLGLIEKSCLQNQKASRHIMSSFTRLRGKLEDQGVGSLGEGACCQA